jgi:hypothetical protein
MATFFLFFFVMQCSCRANILTKYKNVMYRIVMITSPSCYEAHARLFRLSIKGIFDTFGKKLISELLTLIKTCHFMVFG